MLRTKLVTMIQKDLSWSTLPANTFAAHVLMLARDPVALAGTGAPAVLVVISLAVPVMMSLWRSWTEMLSYLRFCIALPCFITHYLALLRAALLCLICIASLHFETHD